MTLAVVTVRCNLDDDSSVMPLMMVPCMDDGDPLMTLMMCWMMMVEPLLVIGLVDTQGDGCLIMALEP